MEERHNMTPWAVLNLDPDRAGDAEVRAAFHNLSRTEHPDARPDAQPGPRWHAARDAYAALRDRRGRETWHAMQAALAGLCPTCTGLGVTIAGRKRMVATCSECRGEGRVNVTRRVKV